MRLHPSTIERAPGGNLTAPLRGIVPPMLTPLAEGGGLDIGGLERLIPHLVDGGVHGLFLLGTTGEGASLDQRACRELVQRTCRLVGGKIPVLVAVTDTRVQNSIALARWCAKAGAAAVVVSAPYYLPLEQEELAAYVRAVAAEQPLPVFLYNMPGLTKTAYEPQTVLRLAQIPRVVGIKDSSGRLGYLQELQQRVGRADWSFLVGTESQLAEAVLTGSHGSVCGGANVDPQTFVALYEAAVRRDTPTIAALQQRVELLNRIYWLAPGNTSIIRSLKYALSCLGICGPWLAEPFRPADERERRIIREHLQELGLLCNGKAHAGAGAALPELIG